MDPCIWPSKSRTTSSNSSYVKIREVALKTCQRRWMIGRSSERGSGISVLAARHDDDDYDDLSSSRDQRLLLPAPEIRLGHVFCEKSLIIFVVFIGNNFKGIFLPFVFSFSVSNHFLSFDLLTFIIIIMVHHQHGYPWPSTATRLYRPSLPVGLQGYILYRHWAVVCRF